MTDTLQDLATERAILGAVLAHGRDQLALAAERLEPRHFADQRHRKVYETALSLLERGDAVDLITVRAELGNAIDAAGGVAYLASMTDGVPAATSMDDWSAIVLDKARRRAAHNLAQKLVEQALAADVETDELLDRHQAALARLIEVTSSGTLLSMREVLKQAQQLIDRFVSNENGTTGIPSGLRDLDEIIGGWQPGTLVVIAARPGQGKSTALAQFASYAGGRGYRGLMFSMEMPPSTIGERMLYAEAGVEKWDLKTKSKSAEVALRQVTSAVMSLSAHQTLWDSREAPTMAQIAARVRTVHQRAKLDYIGVDHMQRVAFDPRLDERIGVGRTAKGLKSLALATGVCVLAPCQLNRTAELKEPTLADLAESGMIEREADVVMFLHPDPETKGKKLPTAHLIVAKHRAGATGRIKLLFDKPTCRFLPMAQEPL